MCWATAEPPNCTPEYAAVLPLAAMTVSLIGSITASSRDATPIPQPFRINIGRQHPARRTASHIGHRPVSNSFVRTADLEFDSDPSRSRTAVQSRRARRGPTATAPLRSVDSAIASLSAPAKRPARPKSCSVPQREKPEGQRYKWHHSQLGKLVRRIGTVPAMSAWKAASGPPEPGQGSRLRRDRRSRLPGLDRVSAGPASWLPRAYGFLQARCSADHEAK